MHSFIRSSGAAGDTLQTGRKLVSARKLKHFRSFPPDTALYVYSRVFLLIPAASGRIDTQKLFVISLKLTPRNPSSSNVDRTQQTCSHTNATLNQPPRCIRDARFIWKPSLLDGSTTWAARERAETRSEEKGEQITDHHSNHAAQLRYRTVTAVWQTVQHTLLPSDK